MLNTGKLLLTGIAVTAIMVSGAVCSANLQDTVQNQGVEHSIDIKMFLKRDVPSANIDVHVDHDIIQLAGFVDNQEQYRNVELVAANYKDKYRVINNVKIVSEKGSVSDERRLKDDIVKQLEEHKYPVNNIDVQVRNGHVILSGFVNKHVSLNRVKLLSKAVPGAVEVNNCLLYEHA